MQFTVHTAKSQLSKLIESALQGEEVVIARGNKPVVRLMPIAQTDFTIGHLKGKLGETPDFIQPMKDGDSDAWEGQ